MKRDSGNIVDTEVVYKKFRTPEDFRASLKQIVALQCHAPIVGIGDGFIVLKKGRDLIMTTDITPMLDVYEGLWQEQAQLLRSPAEYVGYVEKRIAEQEATMPAWLTVAWYSYNEFIRGGTRATHGDATPENCVFIDGTAYLIDPQPRPGIGRPAEDIGKLWLCATTGWGCSWWGIQGELITRMRGRDAFAITDEVRAHAIGHAIRVLHYTPTADFSGLRGIL